MSLIALDLHSFIVATHLFKFHAFKLSIDYRNAFSNSAIVKIILKNYLFETSKFKEKLQKEGKKCKNW
jgi:hypothetical protein